MILHSLNIPEDESQRIRWLDEQLAGYRLPELAAELSALFGITSSAQQPALSASEWLRDRREAFLNGGVAALDESQRRELLRKPLLLLELQAEIDSDGGEFWNSVAMRSTEFAEAVRRGRKLPGISASTTAGDAVTSSEFGDLRPRTVAPTPPTRRHFWMAIPLALAASAVLWLGLRPAPPFAPEELPGGTAWGWNAQDLFNGSPSPQQYLNRLADAGAKWRNKRPESKVEVAQRIREMRAGCRRLIDGQHPPLDAAQAEALKILCRKWADQFDAVAADLESNRKTPLEARDAMDQIVDKLVERLRSGKLA